ncbi:MAG: PilZ domain-containing protein [Desulfobacterales bacterium]|jgi:Tfp pilus assembly protein PilZ
MTVDALSPAGRTINPKLAEKIADLPEDRQWILLKELLDGDITAALEGLISRMSDDQQMALLDQLQDQPTQAVNLEETEISIRSHTRRSCIISANYVVDQRNFDGFVLDISPAGAFIETGEAFAAGQQIQLMFSLPNKSGQMNVSGKILWKNKLGIGLQFEDLSQQQIDLITAFVAENK